MTRYLSHLSIAVMLALASVANPLHAASKPHVGAARQSVVVWTNDDLEKLHTQGLISIVGQVDEEGPTWTSVPETYVKTQDPGWYAEQAANLRARAELMQQIAAIVKKNRWTQTEAAQRCGITQPRMNDLLRGRVSRFSLDALVNIATAIGRRVHMELESV